jgi:hypothetical protein
VAWIRGGATYRFLDREINGTTVQRSNTYSYSVSSALFENRTSPFSVNVNASRVVADLAGEGGRWFGNRTSDFGTASARLTLPERPGATVAYSWDFATDEIPGFPDHKRDLQRLDTGVHHASPSFNLNAAYTGEWSDGNWNADDYQVNTVRVDGSAKLSETTTFTLSDQYYQRSPTSRFDAALASELQYFQAAVYDSPAPREEQRARYIYSNSSLAAQALTSASGTSQQGEYWRELRVKDTEYSGRVTGNVALVEQTRGGATSRTSGETLGLMGHWFRQAGGSLDDVMLGPSFGVLQNASGGNDFGYGANGTLTVSRPLGRFVATGRYGISYGNNLGGVPGWSFRQSAIASGGGALGSGHASAQLQFDASRAWSPTFGDFASRSINFTGAYDVDRTRLRASLAATSGMAGNPGDKFVGDGLLVPAPFNSHTIWGVASASTSSHGVTATVGVRYGDTNVPGQPALIQYGADAALGYAFGAFSISLEDRVTTYGYATGRGTTNLVFLRFFRAIGNSF